MKKILSLLLLFVVLSANAADNVTQKSPDGRLTVTFELTDDGRPTYSVTYDGQTVLDPSPLGFVANFGDFSSGLQMDGQPFCNKDIPTKYSLSRSKQAEVNKIYNVLEVKLAKKNGQKFTIKFHIENNDIAFRYEIPNQPDRRNEKKFNIRVMEEKTGFDFPKGTTTFLTPQSDAMIGWKGTKPSYEEEYVIDAPMETLSQYKHGWTFPGLFKVSGQDSPTPLWVLVSETGVNSDYCASRLSDMKGDGLYTVEFPMKEENNGNGTVEPAFALPGHTPWRTLTIGNNLKPIVETTIPWDFVQEQYTTNNKYKYGRGTWSWIVWQDNSINVDDQKKYIALAKEMGYQYVLIDNWWDNNIGIEKMESLVKYAQSQDVDVFLWYSSSGWWNDIEQGPINVMSNSIQRKKAMRWMKQIGVKGIKVDFFGGDKQETMRHYEQILSDADDNGLMVIFHGCTVPRGWERMYPNYVGSEAVLASENMYFGQNSCDREAQDAALHPFIRNTIGCMEWGGCFMNRHIHKGNKGGNTRRTTDCHELATTVLFQNPIQNFAITPENLGDEPAVKQKNGKWKNSREDYNAERLPAPWICMDYLKRAPTTWDETRFIDGYPGKYVVLARRSGNTWYVAGNNATGAPLTLKLDLDFLQKGDAYTLYSDNQKTREPERADLMHNGKQFIVTMADQGGFVLVK